MKQEVMEAQVRSKIGKQYCKKIRRTGYLPAVLYGKDSPALNLEISEKELKRVLLSGENVVIDLKIQHDGNKNAMAMIAEIQRSL